MAFDCLSYAFFICCIFWFNMMIFKEMNYFRIIWMNCCIFVCAESVPSNLPLTVYFKDWNSRASCLYSECFMSTLDAATNDFYIDDEVMSTTNFVCRLPITDDSHEDQGDLYWPKVPVGQFLWNLVNDQIFTEKTKSSLRAVFAWSHQVHPRSFQFLSWSSSN